jgi:hypothetical protein
MIPDSGQGLRITTRDKNTPRRLHAPIPAMTPQGVGNSQCHDNRAVMLAWVGIRRVETSHTFGGPMEQPTQRPQGPDYTGRVKHHHSHFTMETLLWFPWPRAMGLSTVPSETKVALSRRLLRSFSRRNELDLIIGTKAGRNR